jgi:hypothetical protein
VIRGFLALLVLFAGCRAAPQGPPAGEQAPMTIDEVLRLHADSLMALPGVQGVAQGEQDGRPTVQVLVADLAPAVRQRLPAEIGGYQVQVVETGVIRAQPDSR